MSGTSTPPGWYPDPSNPAQQRYWDGNAWSDATAPGAPAAPAAPGYGVPGAPAYGATTQVGYGYAQSAGAPLAGFWQRFGALFIDSLIIGIPVAIILAVLGVDTTTDAGGTNYTFQLLYFVLCSPYFFLQEGSPGGQTIGKKVLGLQVVDEATLQPGIGTGRAAGRYFARFLSQLICLLGYFWMLWDDQKQTWHDKLGKTKVVKVQK
jgi:uncharacterized RDD family membrane protein YckC